MTDQTQEHITAAASTRTETASRTGETVEPPMSDAAMVAYLTDELAHEQAHVEHLQTALVNARRIGAAIGVLMTSLKVTYDVAFRMLSAASQAENVKLRVVAELVIATGTLER